MAEDRAAVPEIATTGRRLYTRPSLTCYGTVAATTAGGNGGVADGTLFFSSLR
jgi:hypothetical protein